jgi:20S proteasome alpha/beta subunit
MTMVVGFQCTDGLVLCADQQITSGAGFKYHEKKLSIEEGPAWKIVFGYSGTPGLAQEVQEKVMRVVRQLAMPITGEVVKNAADGVLTDMNRLYDAFEQKLELLIGSTAFLGQTELFKFDGRGLHKVNNFSYLGIGECSLIRFLSDKLYSSQLDTQTGAALGAYLVKKAEQYIDGCGGPIDVVVLDNSLGDDCEWLPESSVQTAIQKIEHQESGLADLLIRQPFS